MTGKVAVLLLVADKRIAGDLACEALLAADTFHSQAVGGRVVRGDSSAAARPALGTPGIGAALLLLTAAACRP